MHITYRINSPIAAEQAASLYERSGLARPKELQRIKRMVENANVLISAWDGEQLVGFLRAMTDFSFDCYLNDLAIDNAYQKQGIGKELVRQLQELLGEEVMILLLSARDAVDFYQKIGFTAPPDALWVPNKQ